MIAVIIALVLTFDVRYINLEKRKDRLQLIKNELCGQGVDGVRIQAEEANPQTHRKKAISCAASHIKALKSIESIVGLVVEDDAMFVQALPRQELLLPSFDWDVLLLAHNGHFNNSDCYHRKWCRVKSMQTTSMYAVRKKYISRLLTVWNKSIAGLEAGGDYSKYAIDQTWKELQRTKGHNWFAAIPRIARQRPGYSDIESSFKDYKV